MLLDIHFWHELKTIIVDVILIFFLELYLFTNLLRRIRRVYINEFLFSTLNRAEYISMESCRVPTGDRVNGLKSHFGSVICVLEVMSI